MADFTAGLGGSGSYHGYCRGSAMCEVYFPSMVVGHYYVKLECV